MADYCILDKCEGDKKEDELEPLFINNFDSCNHGVSNKSNYCTDTKSARDSSRMKPQDVPLVNQEKNYINWTDNNAIFSFRIVYVQRDSIRCYLMERKWLRSQILLLEVQTVRLEKRFGISTIPKCIPTT